MRCYIVLEENFKASNICLEMWSNNKMLILVVIIAFSLSNSFLHCQANRGIRNYNFVVNEANYERLCKTKKILTVNGQYPGPTLYVHKGDTIIVNVINKGVYNITIHWHGVKQPRYPWSDGPEYVTQCPIQPGDQFSQKVIFSEEEGTLWWHAHSDWSRATVHGVIIIFPKYGTNYPFPKPDAEVPVILGEWWKADVMEVLKEAVATGGSPNVSDAFTINGQPGDLYPCSQPGTFKLNVDYGKTYLLRIVNAAVNDILFFAIANHKLRVVGADASYTKPLTLDYVAITPGQTLDCLLYANQAPNRYYMAARSYSSSNAIAFDNTTTTGIVQYSGYYYFPPSLPLPYLPYYNDTNAAFEFFGNLRSLAINIHPIPMTINTAIITTISINTFPCPNNTCAGPNGTRLAASMNNISFVNPHIDVLQAYYNNINGIFDNRFPNLPPLIFDFTADYLPVSLEVPERGTIVKVLEYNATVEIVFQGTNLVSGIDHPIHLHGYSFYIVGYGFGNFDKNKDPLNYNIVDPPFRNTVVVPRNGWATIRFTASNPGVWLMHCHLERHFTWGMDTTFIVQNGPGEANSMLPPPPDMPPC